MEILVYAENEKDRRRMEAIFKTFEVLPVTKEDGWQARRLIRAYAASSGIGVLDAIIAATAMREDLVLATHNLKDFQRITGLKVERPY